jgi:hypothetical protein
MGSKQVFGFFIIALGVVLAYLFVTGTLKKVWDTITNGGASTTGADSSSTNPTGTSQTTTPGQADLSSASFGSYTGPATGITGGSPTPVPVAAPSPMPVSSGIPTSQNISTAVSVYSPTLASQTGVTGVIA